MLEARAAAAAYAGHLVASIAQKHEFAMKGRGHTGDSSFIRGAGARCERRKDRVPRAMPRSSCQSV